VADAEIERRMKLDVVMLEFQQAIGFADYMGEIEKAQGDLLRKITAAPREQMPRADLYYLLGKMEGLGIARGLPQALADAAVKLRDDQEKMRVREERKPTPIVHTARSEP